MTSYYNLGHYRRDISSSHTEGRKWFNRGLLWNYGFDLEASRRCFLKAIEADPDCAMHYWGLGLSSGIYYNQPWARMLPKERQSRLADAYDASRKALDCVDAASEVEVALITALATRIQSREPVDLPVFKAWDDDYADAMRQVYQQFPDDVDVCTLFADALVCRTPWKLWDLQTGKPHPKASTGDAITVLETAINRLETQGSLPHPGLLHLYIHVMEMSPFPERALPASNALRELVPDSGHLCHMPSHIDVRCGHYLDAVLANNKAIAADNEYLKREGALNFHTLSRIHNYHLKIYAALFLGQYQSALEAAEELIATTPEQLLRIEVPAMADWMEGYMGMKAHVYIRFGKWQEIIDMPLPEDTALYCMTTATWRYAKAVAFAASGQVHEAEIESEQFRVAASAVPESRTLFNNTCVDVLQIAEQMLEGEIAYRKQQFDIAFAHLRRAVYLDDNLKYDEPWGWMQPARHALGALLLEQGHTEEALTVYRADLGLDDTLVSTSQHHNNIWSLHGYLECLQKTGRVEEAGVIRVQLDEAKQHADVEVNASCYCRILHHCCDT